MKYFDWNTDKDEELRANRNIGFEEVVFALMTGGLLDIIEHPNRTKYPNQRIFIVNVGDYAHLVPFVESEEAVFLKTIIPSRKMTQKYLGGEDNETR
ncbi:MAG: toxin [Chloroflexota bacterium]|nr:toxin [Chloroflexota bacterium]